MADALGIGRAPVIGQCLLKIDVNRRWQGGDDVGNDLHVDRVGRLRYFQTARYFLSQVERQFVPRAQIQQLRVQYMLNGDIDQQLEFPSSRRVRAGQFDGAQVHFQGGIVFKHSIAQCIEYH